MVIVAKPEYVCTNNYLYDWTTLYGQAERTHVNSIITVHHDLDRRLLLPATELYAVRIRLTSPCSIC